MPACLPPLSTQTRHKWAGRQLWRWVFRPRRSPSSSKHSWLWLMGSLHKRWYHFNFCICFVFLELMWFFCSIIFFRFIVVYYYGRGGLVLFISRFAMVIILHSILHLQHPTAQPIPSNNHPLSTMPHQLFPWAPSPYAIEFAHFHHVTTQAAAIIAAASSFQMHPSTGGRIRIDLQIWEVTWDWSVRGERRVASSMYFWWRRSK